MVAVAKLAVLLTGVVSALFGFKHVGVRSYVKSFFRGEAKAETSTCGACLAAGKDFCISDSRCIPRATYKCKGPRDHITGDKEFALHGNPHEHHSMVCPGEKFLAKTWDQQESECPCKAARRDCFANGEAIRTGKCAQLWDTCNEKRQSAVEVMSKPEETNAWPMCTRAKTRCMDEDGKKVLKGRCAYLWEKCGSEWEASKGAVEKKDVDTKDCYFDEECHAKVDWTQIGKLKDGIFARLKIWKEKDDKTSVHDMMPKVHKMFADAGMPDDRIDYILLKWVKSAYPDALDGLKPTEGMSKPEQANAWPMCTMAKARCMEAEGKKMLKGRCGDLWEKCGSEWEANKGSAEKKDVDSKDVDTKDCYFDKECHAKVDWTQIEKLKEGIFGRLKYWKEHEDKNAVREMMPKVHKMFADAGMPEDRIDYILLKWVKYVYADALDGMAKP